MTHKELYDRLIKKIKSYHPTKDFSQLEKAYKIALLAHGEQSRKSGEPFIIHPLSVAIIMADLELDLESIIAGILHDVIEDTKYSYEDIVNYFGKEVAEIVDGVTKFEDFSYPSKEERKAETYRKMFLAMAKDIRVILIKIADRLHNMQTLEHMKEEKQREVSQETLDIYAPLADRLGISRIKDQLEDLSFKYLHPPEYYDLANQIKRKQIERKEFVDNICDALRKTLAEHKIECEVQGRPKHFFSIYKKMVSQGKSLDQIYDLFAVRVIVSTIEECYRVVGIVHEMYTPRPGRFKDYIAMKKENEYQSIHTTLIGPGGEPFEVQIRTWGMHKTAEYGIVAHWKYKQGADGIATTEEEEKKLAWLRQILEWQKDYSHDNNKEYLEALKGDLDIYQDSVYCFTPKGQVITLTRGATPLDFAYMIHSAVGNQAVGARVNGKMVTFDYKLKSGDRVEIVTSRNSSGPSRDWLSIVRTSQARSKINQWFKKEDKEVNTARGKALLEKEAKKRGVALPELTTQSAIENVLARYSYKDWDTLCASVGQGAVKEGQVINRLYDEYSEKIIKETPIEKMVEKLAELRREKSSAKKAKLTSADVVVKGVGSFPDIRLSKCCAPLPGDEIVGFITRGRGVSIHRTDCKNIVGLSELNRERLIETWWRLPEEENFNATYRAELLISAEASKNLFTTICGVCEKENVPIQSINARMNDEGRYAFDVSVEIKTIGQLNSLIKKLKSVKGVYEVRRSSN